MKVIHLMRKMGFSKTRIAKICNISETTVSKILISNFRVSPYTQDRIIAGVTELCDEFISSLPPKEI